MFRATCVCVYMRVDAMARRMQWQLFQIAAGIAYNSIIVCALAIRASARFLRTKPDCGCARRARVREHISLFAEWLVCFCFHHSAPACYWLQTHTHNAVGWWCRVLRLLLFAIRQLPFLYIYFSSTEYNNNFLNELVTSLKLFNK